MPSGSSAKAVHSAPVSIFAPICLASVIERVPFASKINLGNVVGFQMRNVEIFKLRTAKRAIGWPLSLLALWIVEQNRQFPIGIEDD